MLVVEYCVYIVGKFVFNLIAQMKTEIKKKFHRFKFALQTISTYC